MITLEEEKYLTTISETAKVSVKPYDLQIEVTSNKLIHDIKVVDPSAEVLFMGASALKISGQNDIDIYVLSPASEFDKHLPQLIRIFNEPTSIKPNSIRWAFNIAGFDVEIYLTDPESESTKRQIKVFELLRNHHDLCSEYEKLKMAATGSTMREYQRLKYEFYNQILLQNA